MSTWERQRRGAEREIRVKGVWWGGALLACGGAATWLLWREVGGNAALAGGVAALGLWAAPLLAVRGLGMPKRPERTARSGDGEETWERAAAATGVALVRALETPELPREARAELKGAVEALRRAMKSREAGALERVCLEIRGGALKTYKDALWAWARGKLGERAAMLRAERAEHGAGGEMDLAADLAALSVEEVLLRAAPAMLKQDVWAGVQACGSQAMGLGLLHRLGAELVVAAATAMAVEWTDTSRALDWDELRAAALRRMGLDGGEGARATAEEGSPAAAEGAAGERGERRAGDVRIINGKRYRRVRVKSKSYHRHRHGRSLAARMLLDPVMELGASFLRGLRMTGQRIRYGFRVWRVSGK